MMEYRLELVGTALTVGRCACLPPQGVGLAEAAEHLMARPMDSFMHAFAVAGALGLEPDRVAALAGNVRGNPAMLSAICEAALVRGDSAGLVAELAGLAGGLRALAAHSPDIVIKSHLLPDSGLHRAWIELLRRNVQDHEPWPGLEAMGLEDLGLDLPFETAVLESAPLGAATAALVRQNPGPNGFPRDEAPYPAAPDVIRAALAALRGAGLSAGMELRHTSSLSPVAVLRRWGFSVSVESGSFAYSLTGEQTSYGRGLWLEDAGAACIMEVAERRSAWADVISGGEAGTVRGLANGGKLLRGSHADISGRGLEAVDPDSMTLEVPYQGQELHWIEGSAPDGTGVEIPVLVPAQCVLPFLNLDEPSLFSGLGSTGLGAGARMPQARRTALLEVMERDAEAVAPFDPARCFRLTSKDRDMKRLLADYAARGVHICLMDITPEYGVPCYKAFVTGPEGLMAKGTAAGLDGRKAALSAILEIPHPYPDGPPTQPLPGDIPFRRWESLPSYATGSVAGDVALLERVLAGNGLRPVYVDLTRDDLRIPVVRALVPGLEIMADFDRYSRVSPRLLANCLRLGQARSS